MLPSGVRPTHYHIAIVPDLEAATFTADVAIDVRITEPTDAFVLNAVGLTFSSVAVVQTGESGAAVSVTGVTESTEEQRLTVQVGRPIAEAAQLRFSYTAAISDKLFGFYRSHYTYEGARYCVGATQLCPAEARSVFPCWDEPAIKATFALDITVAPPLQVWSNDAPHAVVELPDGSGRRRWQFRPCAVMSTYLVAWVIGDMETAETTIQRTAAPPSADEAATPGSLPTSLVVRAVTPRGKIAQAAFALDVAAKVLPLYEVYFQSPYVFPKLDLIALPNFAFGAMENWGCITFREQALLASPEASATQTERVAMVVAHELAHQWFGNLATMAWWSDLWLNESFATYMATWAVHKLFPEWVVDTQFVFDEGSRAFQLDAMRSSHPIELPVHDVREVDGIFDAISYSKGAMVLRMTAKFVGEAGFQGGLVDYLSRHAYAAATSQQLWDALSGPAAPNLKEVLHSWTREQGFPYVQAVHDAATGSLMLTQHRFLVVNDATPAEDAALWKIPMYCSYGTAEGAVTTLPVILAERTMTLAVPGAVWVKVNCDQIAFCRVQYTEAMLRGLVDPLRAKTLTGTDRYSLVADYAALARGGYCETVPAMELLAHYDTEDEYTVWCEVAQFEKKLRCLLTGSDSAEVRAAFDAFCEHLYTPAMGRLGYQRRPGDSHRAQQTRVLLLKRLLACGSAAATAVAQDMYERRASTPIPREALGCVYAAHLRTGGDAALAELQSLIAATDSAEERTQYLAALCAVPDPATGVPALMEFLLSDAVNSQDMPTVLLGLAEGARTQRLFAEQVMEKWPRLSQKAPSVLLARVLKFLEYGSDASLVDPLRRFFGGLPAETQARTRMTFEQGLEGLLCNAAWAARDATGIARFLLSR